MRKSQTFPAGDITLLKKKLVYWAGNFSCAICIDHNDYPQPDDEVTFLCGTGEITSSENTSRNYFDHLVASFNKDPDWMLGFFTYDIKDKLETALPHHEMQQQYDSIFPEAHFFRPKNLVLIKNDTLIIESISDPHEIYETIWKIILPEQTILSSPVSIRQRMNKEEYLEKVSAIKNHILNGDVYEVNFCQEFYINDFNCHPPSLFSHLNQINPSPFACFLKYNDRYLVCASPERFLKKQGAKLISQPIKGTVRRGKGMEDEVLKAQLLNDPKERAENVMIVDLVRNDLARSAATGSVKVEELFGIYSFPHQHHMISTVSSLLRPGIHFIDAIRYAFPMGSMTGAPKIKAMELIDKYEQGKRGLFSGTVGYITPSGDFDFNVVIRSFIYNAATRYLSFRTGSAITHDSDPNREYEECLLKAKALVAALQYHHQES